MNVQRGDVVLLDYPYASGGRAKVRPALVVQNDRDNQRLVNTIVVQITGMTRRALEPTQLLVAVSTPDGQLSGLRQDSVINCVNILTLEKGKILRRLGTLSKPLLQQVNTCLLAALRLLP
jgi:mRNA interferase MazF